MKIAKEVGENLHVTVNFPNFERRQNIDKLLEKETFGIEVEKRFGQASSLYGGLSLETDYYSELATMEQIKNNSGVLERYVNGQ